MLKKDILLVKKDFLGKTNLNLCFSKLNSFLLRESLTNPALYVSNTFDIKTDLYKLLKSLKKVKTSQYGVCDHSQLNTLCLRLQKAHLYTSFVEKQKCSNLKLLDQKVKCWKINFISLNKVSLADDSLSLLDFARVSSGYKKYDVCFKYVENKKFKELLTFLKARRFFDKIFISQFSKNLNVYKKKYQLLKNISNVCKVKIRILTSLYTVCFLKYLKAKYKTYKIYKKLIWKRKRRKKWKQNTLFRFFRSRHRLFYKFYIPRHFEINYKTFNFAHLDKLEVSGLNSKITFWLNLRRLLTFLSS